LVEHDFEVARRRAGMMVGDHLIMATIHPVVASMVEPTPVTVASVKAGATLREVYDSYMADPTRDRPPKRGLPMRRPGDLRLLSLVMTRRPARSPAFDVAN
jgi:hypothetical protein